MAQQYIRAIRLTVDGAGEAINFIPTGPADDRALRVRFDVHQRDSSTPHHANIYIYNLSSKTNQKLLKKEHATLTLDAGYASGYGTIFKGEVIQVRVGRENVTDTYTHILATSSERARNTAVVSKSLAKGHTFKDQVDVAAKAFKEFGVKVGHIDDLGSQKFPRGTTLHGMAKDLLRDICFATGSSWHIQGNELNIVKNGSTKPGNTIVLNSDTGMVGLPEQTIDGVVVRCLLNYRILPTQKLKINESSIQQAALSPSYSAGANNELFKGQLGLAADGVYKALLVEHNGDSRGPNWYTEIICVKNDGGESISLISRGITDDQN